MDGALLKRPSALLPVAMSVAALATVIGYAAMFGIARQEDEEPPPTSGNCSWRDRCP